MHKEFKATYLYIIKAIMVFAAVITSFLVFNFIMMILNALIPTWLFYTLNVIFALFTLLFLFLQLTSKKPGFIFHDDGFKYKRKNIQYIEIKRFIPAKGGSEPEIVFHDNNTYVLELSWFLKKDRQEIEQIIATNIK
ncbi:MAG: hypothetical protein HRT69_03765 [Flavobacteriaceae bacterium]|nr:hypothetical protein [Flavobacteriaceae bacterium]